MGLWIVGVYYGYFWDDECVIVECIWELGVCLFFVVIIFLWKENFINWWKVDFGVDFVMGVGGMFDVVVGKVKCVLLWM